VCYYWVCALKIDAAKMCAVDAMFISVFLGTGYGFTMLYSKRRGLVFIVAIVAVW
jgi:hypothetical protein